MGEIWPTDWFSGTVTFPGVGVDSVVVAVDWFSGTVTFARVGVDSVVEQVLEGDGYDTVSASSSDPDRLSVGVVIVCLKCGQLYVTVSA